MMVAMTAVAIMLITKPTRDFSWWKRLAVLLVGVALPEAVPVEPVPVPVTTMTLVAVFVAPVALTPMIVAKVPVEVLSADVMVAVPLRRVVENVVVFRIGKRVPVIVLERTGATVKVSEGWRLEIETEERGIAVIAVRCC